jgi:hypothetical protein
MIDRNLWDAAQRVRGTTGACADERPDEDGSVVVERGAD